MTTKICSITGCHKKARSRGWCDAHYALWRKYGDPEAPVKTPRKPGVSMQEIFAQELARAIPNGDCLEGVCSRSGGYPMARLNGKGVKLARMAVALRDNLDIYGPWKALHSCDNPPCINPDHLRAGTQADNSADMVRRGRHYNGDHKGEKNQGAKLTEEGVRKIRQAHADGERQKDIALRFGVCPDTIRVIVKRQTWQHVA